MLKLKKYLIYTHRYLGLAFCVMFALWFVSGVVMIYKRMPRLSAEERLARLPALDFSRVTLTPEQAYQRTGWSEAPRKVRLGMFNGRPVYRFLLDKGLVTVFADNGGRLDPVTPAQGLEIVKAFAPEHRGGASYEETIVTADQWTLISSLRRFKPLHKVALNDEADTHFYVSQVTGEERWLYNGLHSLDFPYLYQSRPAWEITVIALSLGGCLLSLTAVWLAWRRTVRGVKWRRFHALRWRPVGIVSE